METLPKLPGELPEGCIACTACGSLVRLRQTGRGPTHPRCQFEIGGCKDCGHIMRVLPDLTCRDLTRAEAAELAESPDFQRMRQHVDAHLMSRNLWG